MSPSHLCNLSLTERTALSKTTNHLSSVSLLMSVESNSGAADARATVTGPSAEVSARLNPLKLKSYARIHTTLEILLLLHTKITKNCLHQMRFLGSNATEMCWRPGLCPGPRKGRFQRSLDRPSSRISGAASLNLFARAIMLYWG